MLNIKQLFQDGLRSLFNYKSKGIYYKVKVGSGFYALQTTISKTSKKAYTKLVQADKSNLYIHPIASKDPNPITKPIIGMRFPEKRKGRRKVVAV